MTFRDRIRNSVFKERNEMIDDDLLKFQRVMLKLFIHVHRMSYECLTKHIKQILEHHQDVLIVIF